MCLDKIKTEPMKGKGNLSEEGGRQTKTKVVTKREKEMTHLLC